MKNPTKPITSSSSGTSPELTWEEQSGFLEFLASVSGEVATFNNSMDFDLRYEVSQPESIDGDRTEATNTVFLITRRNQLMPEKVYCLYSLFREKALHTYIGLYNSGRIETLKELEPLEDFKEGQSVLYDWLRELLKASSDKL